MDDLGQPSDHEGSGRVIHDFQDKLAQEQADTLRPELRVLLKHAFPSCDRFRVCADRARQREGIDIEIPLPLGPPITIDWKLRSETRRPRIDVLLEFEHRYPNGSVVLGWAADPHKTCDLFGYVWKRDWSGLLLPRRALQRAWARNRECWLGEYGEQSPAPNAEYDSINCAVPMAEVLREVGGTRIVDQFGARWFERFPDGPSEHFCLCGACGAFGARGNFFCGLHKP